jgi:hypothetical protein
VIFRSQSDYDIEVLREKISQAVNQTTTKNGLDETREATTSDALEIRPTEPVAEKKEPAVREKIVEKEKNVEKEEKTENGIELKFCPDCSAVMLKRKAKNGVNAGKMFWICSTYPACRGMRSV